MEGSNIDIPLEERSTLNFCVGITPASATNVAPGASTSRKSAEPKPAANSKTFSPRRSSSSSLSSSSSTVYEEHFIVETLDQGVYGFDPGVKNELGQEKDELLKPKLKARHVVMISLGGVVGTGLFLGTAESLKLGGPLGLVLAYLVVATICYLVLIPSYPLQMICYLPLPGGLIQLAERFVGPSLSFALGWTIFYNWLIVLPAEISAATILVGYWDQTTNPAIYITAAIFIITVINLLGAKSFGETEFWLTSLKVLCISCLLILSVLLMAGVGNEGVIGFRYWKAPWTLFNQYPLDSNRKNGAFVHGPLGRFLGFWSVLLRASFSFQGSEIIGVIAGETKDPRKILPICIKSIWIRVLVFYVMGTLAISLVCPSNDINLSYDENTAVRSPFVIAIHHAGIRGLASLINAVLITSALSAGSSNLYTSSRALYALSLTRRAPRIFCKTTTNGLPLPSILVGILFSCLAYLCLQESTNQIFEYFLNMTSVAGMSTWACICFTYIRFRKGFRHQKLDPKALPYRSWGQPFLAWYGLIWSILIILFNGWAVFLPNRWHWQTFASSYVGIPLFLIALCVGRYLSGQGLVRCCVMDFTSGLSLLVEQETADDPAPTSWSRRFFNFVA
ncbi:hypothetical protein CBS101457_005507 [Exobasidium rhododendri]|nr:hypothetical protein CBS101457_005507 [Exobasidium rhododendri]